MKNVKIQNSETMQSYFTRVGQIKEQLEAVEENVVEGEIVMTTLNGLPKSWDSFIQGICARRRLISFSRLWEECTQEEARLITRKRKWDKLNIKLSQFTLEEIIERRRTTITTRGRTIIRKDKS